MDFLVIAVASSFAAALTLYSGFGLGTILLPVFALFFPIEVAVVATAVVHGANNVFKVSMVGKFADRETVVRFGVPAVIAAIAGSALLGWFTTFEPLATWSMGALAGVVTPIKLLMGLLMFGFALFELLPSLKGIRFDKKHYLAGGLLSGFFGGLSGHQGALRSAFLVKSGMDTQAFVGTSSMIGLLVDLVRILTYFLLAGAIGLAVHMDDRAWPLVITGCLAAFAGVVLGKQFLHKVRIGTIQTLTGLMLFLIAFLLGFGLI